MNYPIYLLSFHCEHGMQETNIQQRKNVMYQTKHVPGSIIQDRNMCLSAVDHVQRVREEMVDPVPLCEVERLLETDGWKKG